MTLDVAMVRADVRIATAGRRHAFAQAFQASRPRGSLLLSTCHRVELTGDRAAIAEVCSRPQADGFQMLEGEAVARHLLRVAVGLESVVVGENEVLHQLRTAVADARGRAPLSPQLDHLADLSLRAGRRARSWLPAGRPSLADEALDRVGPVTGPVMVVGAGAMGTLTARAVRGRGLSLMVASRTPERALRLAETWEGRVVPWDPEAGVVQVDGIVVALNGPWTIAPETAALIADHVHWVVDLSSPPALDSDLVRTLGPRHVSIDDLATRKQDPDQRGVHARLEELVDATLADFVVWATHAEDRQAARDLGVLAVEARATELDALWGEVGGLGPKEREAIERMAERLTGRLLRDPLERLGRDGDGRYQRAARDLFGL